MHLTYLGWTPAWDMNVRLCYLPLPLTLTLTLHVEARYSRWMAYVERTSQMDARSQVDAPDEFVILDEYSYTR